MSTSPRDAEGRRRHWEHAHEGKQVTDVSWWQEIPTLSLRLVERSGVPRSARIVDVGAGWSTLADHLLARGFTDVTAVDLSEVALATARSRVGDLARHLTTQVGDVLDLRPDRAYDLWHDRAVFHFLTDAYDRDRYRAAVDRSVAEDGWLAVATFGPQGPESCSGLPVVRYSSEELAEQFPGFVLEATDGEEHRTPWGSVQQFAAVLLRRA